MTTYVVYITSERKRDIIAVIYDSHDRLWGESYTSFIVRDSYELKGHCKK